MPCLRNVLAHVTLLLPVLAQTPLVPAPDTAPMANGITVEGTGDAKVAADTLEYRGLLVKGGGTPGDALVEYDRAVARLPKALEQLGLKGLTFELRGMQLTSLSEEQWKQRQRQAMSYGGLVPSKCEVKDYLTIRVPLDGVEGKGLQEAVAAVLGVAMELNLEDPDVRRRLSDPYGNLPSDNPDGWIPGITFVLRDATKLYAAAMKNASDDARSKAELQAGLVGGKLGRVVAVDTRAGGRVEPGRMRDLQHRVVLRVRYELSGT